MCLRSTDLSAQIMLLLKTESRRKLKVLLHGEGSVGCGEPASCGQVRHADMLMQISHFDTYEEVSGGL